MTAIADKIRKLIAKAESTSHPEEAQPEAEAAAIAEMTASEALDADFAEARASQPEAEAADEDEASEEEIRDYLKGAFALAFMNAGGNQSRRICKALRAVAISWDGNRKEFIQAAEDNGVHPATAGTQWQVGRSKG